MYTGEIQNEASETFEIKVTSGPDAYLFHMPKGLMPKGARIGSGVTVETSEAGLSITVGEPE